MAPKKNKGAAKAESKTEKKETKAEKKEKSDTEPRVSTISCAGFDIPLEELQNLYFRNKFSNEHANSERKYPQVRVLPQKEKQRIVITGGAGFVGSHLVDRLMLMGHDLIVLDNYFTGTKANIEHWIGHPNFELIRHDVVEPINIECDRVYHLACPASPPHYQYNAIKTCKTAFLGTMNMLGLAKRCKARFLVTSTSEIYGDPEIHPQKEEYWGNVNPTGIRACYDEGKRVGETMTYCYQRQHNVEVRVARIFNTYGPRMSDNDGRVVSNFIVQSLKDEPITIYGDGLQTRSFQYVHDLVSGLIDLMESDYSDPVNIGNPEEYTIKQFAEYIRECVNPSAKITYHDAVSDDPKKRKPDISRAKKVLNWEPKFHLKQGIEETVKYFQGVLDYSEDKGKKRGSEGDSKSNKRQKKSK